MRMRMHHRSACVCACQAFLFDRHAEKIGRMARVMGNFAPKRPHMAMARADENATVGSVMSGQCTPSVQLRASMSQSLSDGTGRERKVSIADAATVASEAFQNGQEYTAEELADALRGSVYLPTKTRAQFRRESLWGGAGLWGRGTSHDEGSHKGRRTSQLDISRADRGVSAPTSVGSGRNAATGGVELLVGGPLDSGIDGGRGRKYTADLGGESGGYGHGPRSPPSPTAASAGKRRADPTSAGVLRWKEERTHVSESCGTVACVVERVGGVKGEVTVQYKTKDQKARAGKDYQTACGQLVFRDGDDTPQTVEVTIVDDGEFERDEEFTLVLHDLTGGATFDESTDGGKHQAIMAVVICANEGKADTLKKALSLLHVRMPPRAQPVATAAIRERSRVKGRSCEGAQL
jgi:hypothetical protein